MSEAKEPTAKVWGVELPVCREDQAAPMEKAYEVAKDAFDDSQAAKCMCELITVLLDGTANRTQMCQAARLIAKQSYEDKMYLDNMLRAILAPPHEEPSGESVH